MTDVGPKVGPDTKTQREVSALNTKGQRQVATVFKAPKNASTWTIVYTDHRGKRRKKKGYTDRRESERLGMKLEERARKILNGDINPKDERYRDHEAVVLTDHLEDFKRSLRGKGVTAKHI